jgi:DNA-binding NarL/FixJ family response regulator
MSFGCSQFPDTPGFWERTSKPLNGGLIMTTADETQDFTEQEFQVIFAVCRGGSNKEIATQCGIAEDAVKVTNCNIFDKLGDVSNRLELHLFARTALNAELRRRSGRSEEVS